MCVTRTGNGRFILFEGSVVVFGKGEDDPREREVKRYLLPGVKVWPRA